MMRELPLRNFVREFESTAWRAAREAESIRVWDLDVIRFERDAYVRCVLADPAAPDLDDYLARRLIATA